MTIAKKPPLTPRLEQIAAMVPVCEWVADVGTDHAYIPIFLIQQNRAQRAVASDVLPGPLERARQMVQRYGLEHRIELRLADGLDGLRPVEHIVIAGMGGELICNLLSKEPQRAKQAYSLVLQPMNQLYEVRKYLHQAGFCIVQERLAKEGHRVYHVLQAQPGKQRYEDDLCYHVGPLLVAQKDPVLPEYLQQRISAMDAQLTQMASSADDVVQQKRSELLQLRQQFAHLKEGL